MGLVRGWPGWSEGTVEHLPRPVAQRPGLADGPVEPRAVERPLPPGRGPRVETGALVGPAPQERARGEDRPVRETRTGQHGASRSHEGVITDLDVRARLGRHAEVDLWVSIWVPWPATEEKAPRTTRPEQSMLCRLVITAWVPIHSTPFSPACWKAGWAVTMFQGQITASSLTTSSRTPRTKLPVAITARSPRAGARGTGRGSPERRGGRDDVAEAAQQPVLERGRRQQPDEGVQAAGQGPSDRVVHGRLPAGSGCASWRAAGRGTWETATSRTRSVTMRAIAWSREPRMRMYS